MNQFDDFFKEKLNEEQPFSGQKRSWTQLNRNLAAVEIGSGLASRSVTLWKALGIVAVLSTAALIWDRQTLVNENKRLKDQRNQAELQNQVAPSSGQPMATMSKPEANIIGRLPVPEVNTFRNTPQNVVGFPTKPTIQSPVNTRMAPFSSPGNLESPSNILAANNIEIPIDTQMGSPEIADARNQQQPQSLSNAHDSTAENTHVAPTQFDKAVATVIADSTQKTAAVTASDSVQHVDNKAIESKTLPIDPVKNMEKKWSAGVRLMAGFPQPKEPGISLVHGQGIKIAYRFWKNFSVAASAEFLRFDVDADTLPRNFVCLPTISNGPGHHFTELRNVSSNQILQYYNLGVGYSHKIIGRWNVSANLAHSWAHLPSRKVSFLFEEIHGGGPGGPGGGGGHPEFEYFREDSHEKWVSNLWRFGLGLQYETPRWILGVNADYSKRFTAEEPLFNTVLASADVLYKF